MAVAAVDSELARVVAVAEGHRLLKLFVLPRVPRRNAIVYSPKPSAPMITTAPKMLARAIRFVLRWKICGIDSLCRSF